MKLYLRRTRIYVARPRERGKELMDAYARGRRRPVMAGSAEILGIPREILGVRVYLLSDREYQVFSNKLQRGRSVTTVETFTRCNVSWNVTFLSWRF